MGWVWVGVRMGSGAAALAAAAMRKVLHAPAPPSLRPAFRPISHL